MIDIMSDDTLTLTQASRILPPGRNGARPHQSTIFRWITDGVKSSGGTLVRLEAVRFGAKWITSREAIRKFVAALTPDRSVKGPAKEREVIDGR